MAGTVRRLHGNGPPPLSRGRPQFSVHHHRLYSTQEVLARASNRLGLALVTSGLYLSDAFLTLHAQGPTLLGHMPWLAVIAFVVAGLLSLRLVIAISRSGHL